MHKFNCEFVNFRDSSPFQSFLVDKKRGRDITSIPCSIRISPQHKSSNLSLV